jgi:hypothetical protein
MKEFVLLKQTFPISEHDRYCDLYLHLKEVGGVDMNDFNEIIRDGEKYLYRVGKEKGKFKTMHISLHNFEVSKKKYSLFKD